MQFELDKSVEILTRTPSVLNEMLADLSEDWTHQNEGGETWSAFDVLGHLIHGERTDWIPRLEIILSNKPDKSFEPFDRFAQFEQSEGKSLNELLQEFMNLRATNIDRLVEQQLTEDQLDQVGHHPQFGAVTARQLLSTWVVHDLNHLAQISRVMAFQYADEVGPWTAYLRILNQ